MSLNRAIPAATVLICLWPCWGVPAARHRSRDSQRGWWVQSAGCAPGNHLSKLQFPFHSWLRHRHDRVHCLGHSQLSVQIPKSRQGEDEVRALHDFVAQARLPVVPESIQKRDPPEPDILCRLKSGEQLAFELVELCHPTNAAWFWGAFPLTNLIEKNYQNLPSEIKFVDGASPMEHCGETP